MTDQILVSQVYDLTEFEITQDHLTLLQNMLVEWDSGDESPDYRGVPSINKKKPYGNYDYLSSINNMLDLGFEQDDEGEFDEEATEVLRSLHEDTEHVLQIVLATGEMRPGKYKRAEEIPWEWERVKSSHSQGNMADTLLIRQEGPNSHYGPNQSPHCQV